MGKHLAVTSVLIALVDDSGPPPPPPPDGNNKWISDNTNAVVEVATDGNSAVLNFSGAVANGSLLVTDSNGVPLAQGSMNFDPISGGFTFVPNTVTATPGNRAASLSRR